MSLFKKVADMVIARGEACIDDLMPHLPGVGRNTVLNALKHARQAGLIHCAPKEPRRGNGLCAGSLPAMHYPGPKPVDFSPKPKKKERNCTITVRPPCSVWELSHGLQIPGTWPPVADGRRFNLLGSWEA